MRQSIGLTLVLSATASLFAIGCCLRAQLAETNRHSFGSTVEQMFRPKGQILLFYHSSEFPGWCLFDPITKKQRNAPLLAHDHVVPSDRTQYMWRITGSQIKIINIVSGSLDRSIPVPPYLGQVENVMNSGESWVVLGSKRWRLQVGSHIWEVPKEGNPNPLAFIHPDILVCEIRHGDTDELLEINFYTGKRRTILLEKKVEFWAADSSQELIYGFCSDSTIRRWRWDGNRLTVDAQQHIPADPAYAFCEGVLPITGTDCIIYSMRQREVHGLLKLDRNWIRHYALNMKSGTATLAIDTPDDSLSSVDAWVPSSTTRYSQ